MATTMKRLYGPAALTGSAADLYTAPAATTAIARKIHLQNNDSVARTVTMSIGADASGTRILDAKSIPANDFITLWGPWTLAAAEKFTGSCSSANKIVITIDGEERAAG
jgi:hypothetical protein